MSNEKGSYRKLVRTLRVNEQASAALESKYGVLIRWDPESDCWIAQCWEMPGVMADGPTREDALRELMIPLTMAIEVGENPAPEYWTPKRPTTSK